MTRTSSGRAVIFRGWGDETDGVAKALSAANIDFELAETLVPAILGGGLVVCEVLVHEADSVAAKRIVTRVMRVRVRI